MMLGRSLLILVGFVLPSICRAEFQVNTFTEDDQSNPSAAMDVSGNFVVVWDSYPHQDGDSGGIYAQRFDSAGRRQGAEVRINETTEEGQARPSVSMDSVGNFVVAWDSAHMGSHEDVFGRIFDSAGQPLTGEFQVNTFSDSRQIDPAVTMNGSGAFVVVWVSDTGIGPGGHEFKIRGRKYDAAAVPLGAEFEVSDLTVRLGAPSEVAIDESGAFVAVWSERVNLGSANTSADIGMRLFNADATPKTDPIHANSVGERALDPMVALDGSGNFLVSWYQHDIPILARWYDSDGLSLTEEFPVTSSDAMLNPSVAVAEDGRAFFSWRFGWIAENDSTMWDVMGRSFGSDRNPQVPEFRINNQSGSMNPSIQIATNPTGDFTVVVWSIDTQDGSDYDVFAVVNPAGFEPSSVGHWNVYQ